MLAACGNNGCETTRESYLYTQFKATGRVSLSSVYAWALTAEGDSLMTYATSPTEMELMLQPDTTGTRIRLHCTVNDNGDPYEYDDTLSLSYESYPYFLNMECGCSVYFDISEATVTQHLFKSLTLKNNEITNDEKVNIVLAY